MKRFAYIFAAAIALVVVNASPTKVAPPQRVRVLQSGPPATLADGSVHYFSSSVDYILRFAADGTYEEVWVHRDGTQPGHKTGHYTFVRNPDRTYTLTVDTVTYSVNFLANCVMKMTPPTGTPQNWFWEKLP